MATMTSGPPATSAQWVRRVGNVVNLTTPLGLLVSVLGRARLRPGPRGLLLAERYRLPFPRAGAFTVGDVLITGSDWPTMLRRYPNLIRHEEGHSWQYLYCLGLPFYPAYLLCMGWSWLRTGDRAARNLFERQAGLDLAGYHDLPARPVSAALLGLLTARRPSGPPTH